jgi:hypothetical protein
MMSDTEQTGGWGFFNGLSDDDTASVFCFSDEQNLFRAYDVIEKTKCWLEKRKATTGALYPYWLVCRADTFDKVGELLKKDGIQWDDVESHYYKSIKAQSGIHALEKDLANQQHVKAKSDPKRWWQFWKEAA